MLEALNIFFFIFHTILILFVLLGWISSRFRKWHLLVIILTALSWFGLGYFYVWGYCFLTDWHWSIRRELGYSIDSSSYIHFLLIQFNLDFWNETVTTILAIISLFTSSALSIFLNIRDRIK